MSKRDELAAVLGEHVVIHHGTYATCSCGRLIADMDSHPFGDYDDDHRVHVADAVLAWLGEELDPLLTAADIVLAEADEEDREDPNLDELAYCAKAVVAWLGLGDAAQDAQDGAVGPGSVQMGTGEGAGELGRNGSIQEGDA